MYIKLSHFHPKHRVGTRFFSFTLRITGTSGPSNGRVGTCIRGVYIGPENSQAIDWSGYLGSDKS